jgi:hypothetical protein
MNPTVRVLIVFLICMILGQAGALGVGLLIDPYSPTLALAFFIPAYYAMYWVAWRVALRIADNSADVVPARAASGGASRSSVVVWLLAPAALALDFCD